MVRGKKRGIITVSSTIWHQGQKRFVTAHELGHWMLHPDMPNFIDDEDNLHEWHSSSSKYEVEANTFAAEFLMPTALFTAICKGKKFSVELIQELSEYFKTSYTATAFRFTEVGHEPIMVVYSQNKRVQWFKPSDDFAFGFYDKKFPVPLKTLTYSCYENGIKEPDGDTALAKIWFPNDYNVREDQYLNEDIFPFPKINACLTFLWQHEVNFEDF